jgi:hypothetical protein
MDAGTTLFQTKKLIAVVRRYVGFIPAELWKQLANLTLLCSDEIFHKTHLSFLLFNFFPIFISQRRGSFGNQAITNLYSTLRSLCKVYHRLR